MPQENVTPLTQTEYNAIGKAILDMVASYPELPDGCIMDYQDMKGINHMGVITTPGGRYLSQDVTGGFEAQLPFDIVYCCAGESNRVQLSAEELLNSIADYLENMSYPALTGGRTILKIIMNSVTYRTSAAPDGSVSYKRSGNLRYEKQ